MAERDEDAAWLAARERGEDVSHVPAEVRARYEALGALIEQLPPIEPPVGWQQRLRARLDAEDAASSNAASAGAGPALVTAPEPAPVAKPEPAPVAKPKPKPLLDDDELARQRGRKAGRGWLVAAGALVAAAIVLVVVLVGRGPAQVALREPVVRSEIRHAQAGPSRGTAEAVLGDTLVIHAEADQAIELRVYGDTNELLARCREGGGCTVERDGERRRYTLEVELRATGEVRTILFPTGDRELPAHDLDADLQAAHDAGIVPRPSGVLHVQ